MKVLHLLNSDRLSGAESVAIEIIMAFKDEIEMAYSSPFGIINKTLNERNLMYLPLSDFSRREIKSVVNSYKPDIIHAHDIRSSIQAVRVAKKIPVISHIHGNHFDMKKSTLKSLLYLIASIKITHIIGVSKSVISDYKYSRFIKNKSTVLYNVINKERVIDNTKCDSNNYSYDFVYLGRLSEPKNPKRIAKIASLVLSMDNNIRFGVIGQGDMMQEMKDVFTDHDVLDRVDFLGFMKNPYKILSQSKVMMICSRFEGTPIAALEALMLGIPIVSTPTDGLIELIDDDSNGYICDDDDSFSELVYNIISNKTLFDRLSKGAVLKSLSYCDLKQYKENINKIYLECIKIKCNNTI